MPVSEAQVIDWFREHDDGSASASPTGQAPSLDMPSF
jgi:hypothetical protein